MINIVMINIIIWLVKGRADSRTFGKTPTTDCDICRPQVQLLHLPSLALASLETLLAVESRKPKIIYTIYRRILCTP